MPVFHQDGTLFLIKQISASHPCSLSIGTCVIFPKDISNFATLLYCIVLYYG